MASRELQGYISSRRFKDGLKRCNNLLKKRPNESLLLLYKSQFLFELSLDIEALSTLNILSNQDPSIIDLDIIEEINEIAYIYIWRHRHPPLLFNTENIDKLWQN